MKSTIALSLAAAAFAGAALALPLTPADAPVTVPLDGQTTINGIDIGCTGIGQSKADPRWKAFPIRIEFSDPARNLLGDEAAVISTPAGASLASVRCEGPWIMVRPAPGSYRLEAWLPGQPELKHQTVSFSAPAKGQPVIEIQFPVK